MRLLTIISLCTILSLPSQAQDSIFTKLANYNSINSNLKPYYAVPALKKLNSPVSYTNMQATYTTEQSEKYIIQKGNDINNFNINIESFQAKKNNINLWGHFKYNNITTQNVNFNETLDYDYLYPYIMTDSVGGKLTDEHYAILGGLSKTKNRSTFAFETSFVGKQSVRKRDPRTNNISSNVNATLSYAYNTNAAYSLALSLIGERYVQKAKVSFNSELGRPTVFHETGLGNYNKIFADTRDNAEYLGYNYGLALNYVPSNQIGFFFNTSYIQTSIDKKIKDVAIVVNEANKTNLEVNSGYKYQWKENNKAEIGLAFKQHHIKGTEGIFDNKNTSTNIQKISSSDLFDADYTSFGGYLAYQKQYASSIWHVKIQATQTTSKETYLLPFSEENISYLNLKTNLGLNQQLGNKRLLVDLGYAYTNPTEASYSRTGFNTSTTRYAMLTNNFDYKNTKVSLLDAAVKLAMPVKKLQSFFIGVNGSYAQAYNFKQYALTSGFVF